jgi:starch-binding outer membrane protein, SusD/RagB family
MRKHTLALLAGLVLAGGCNDSTVVSPENSATVDALSGALTRAGVQTLALGVLAADRAFVRGDFTYYQASAIYARDAYRIEATEPRYVTETLLNPADPGSFAGSGGWTNGYVAIRAATSLLDAVRALDPAAPGAPLTAAERNVTIGLIQTMKALDYYRLLELRDTLGVAIMTSDPLFVPPISCKASVMNHIIALLDSANTALVAAGSGAVLPFTVPSGFTAYGRNYTQQPNLIKLNKGLRGKVKLYQGLQHTTPTAGAFAEAITDLTTALGGAAPGAVAPSTFNNGAYVTFVAGGTEAAANPIPLASVGANPKSEAGLEAGDTRASKFTSRTSISGSGVSTNRTFTFAINNATNQARPLQILRDEEVVLLRAQAYFEAGQFANGLLDLNSVRTFYGLAPRALPTSLAEARLFVLYEKRYSLIFEGPQRLVDLRAYSLLKPVSAGGVITPEGATDTYNTAFPIPKGERDARGGNFAVSACS